VSNDASTSSTVTEIVNSPPPPPPLLGDVSALVSVTRDSLPGQRNATFQLVTLHNTSGQTLQGPLYLVLGGLGTKLHRKSASGFAHAHGDPGDPYVLDSVTLDPGGYLTLLLRFSNPKHLRLRFTTLVLAGPGAV
jgi:hypothetical protein